MTTGRMARLLPSVALAALLVATASCSGSRTPTVLPSPSLPTLPPSVPAASVAPDTVLAREIARDTVRGPAGSQADTAVEPFVAVDPHRPSVVVAVFQMGRFPDGGAAAIGFAASDDGGATWTSGVLPGLTRAAGGAYLRVSDPSVAFGPDGSAYASSIVIGGPDRGGGIAVHRSDDRGQTWNAPVFLERTRAGAGGDFPRIAVDTGSASRHVGRVYVTYVHGERAATRWSDDRAVTWSPRRFVSPGRGFVPNVVVGPAGDVTVVYFLLGPQQTRRLFSRTSGDGGTSFDPPVPVGVMRARPSRGLRAAGVEETAVDPVRGTLFVVWEDASDGHGGLNDVVISRSQDGGSTWTTPSQVNQDGSGGTRDHLQPNVEAFDGRVYVVFFTRAGPASGPSSFVQLRSVSSADGGVTFEGERTIGPPADLRFAAVVRPGRTRFLGDYTGVALSAGSLAVVWARSFPPAGPAGHHSTIWASIIQVAL